jgi:proliferating cell nuclear antigen
MKVRLEKPAEFVKAIELISELVTEVKIKVNEFGLSIVAIDPAKVAMVGFKLPKTAFSIFEIESEEVLGINLEDFKKILKRVGTKGIISFETEEKELKINIEERIRRNFSLALIDISGEEKDMPNLEFSCKIKLTSADFIVSIEDCSVVSEACSFIIKDGKFIVESKGLNSARSEFSCDEAEILAEDSKARYSLEYLIKFVKACKLSEKTILNFASDHPLKMDIKTEHMELSFILAPRVETED